MKRTFNSIMVAISAVMLGVAAQDCARPFDVEFWKYQNMIRTDPASFVPFLEDWLSRYTTDTMYTTVQGTNMMSNEGKPAVQELIDFLKAATAIHALKWSDPLYKAALDLAKEQGPTGETGHTGPTGSTMKSRIEKQGPWESTIGENIMYGGDTPLEAILGLAIDDGVAGRGHRVNIFKEEFFYTGMATEMHKEYRSGTVTTFSGMWTPDKSYAAPAIEVPATAAKYKENGYSVWDKASSCDDGAKTGGAGTGGAGTGGAGTVGVDSEKSDTACDFTMAVFNDNMCTQEPDGNKKSYSTTSECMKFDETRDVWYLDMKKLQDNAIKDNGDKNDLSSLFPAYVKHACQSDKFTIEYFTDKECKTSKQMMKATTWGECSTLDMAGTKQYFTITAGAAALKATVVAMMAITANLF